MSLVECLPGESMYGKTVTSVAPDYSKSVTTEFVTKAMK